MGKISKIMMILCLVIGLAALGISYLSAKEAGMSFRDILATMNDNFNALNMENNAFVDWDESKSFESEGLETVVLRSTFPDVQVIPGDKLEIKIKGKVSKSFEEMLSYRREGSQLTIDVGAMTNSNPTSTGVKAELTLPLNQMKEIRVNSQSGSVSLGSIGSERVQVASISGTVNIQAHHQSVQADSDFGSIDIQGEGLDLAVSSIRGDVSLAGSSFLGSVQSVSGSIYGEIESLAGDLEILTDNGNIDITSPKGLFAYDIGTRNGWVSAFGKQGETKLTGGKGAFVLRLSSSTGSASLDDDKEP